MNVPNVRGGVLSLAEQFAPLRQKFAAPGEEAETPATGEEPAAPAAGEGQAADPLEEAARREREYVRERLREDLGREPTEEETNDWLRRHTEGY